MRRSKGSGQVTVHWPWENRGYSWRKKSRLLLQGLSAFNLAAACVSNQNWVVWGRGEEVNTLFFLLVVFAKPSGSSWERPLVWERWDGSTSLPAADGCSSIVLLAQLHLTENPWIRTALPALRLPPGVNYQTLFLFDCFQLFGVLLWCVSWADLFYSFHELLQNRTPPPVYFVTPLIVGITVVRTCFWLLWPIRITLLF